MAGVDVPDKLRRALGQGKVVPVETITKMLAPFDLEKKGGISRAEYAEFLAHHGVGGKWFCDLVTRSTWKAIEAFFMDPIQWIKTEAVAQAIHEFMKLQTRPAKRFHITPESAQGYEPMYYLDGTPVVPNAGPVKPPFVAPVQSAPVAPQSRVRAPEPFTKPPGRPIGLVPPTGGNTVPAGATPRAGATSPRAPVAGATAPRAPVVAPVRPASVAAPARGAPAAGPAAGPGAGGAPGARPGPALPRRPGPRR